MWTKIRDFFRALREMLNTAHDVGLIDHDGSSTVSGGERYEKPSQVGSMISKHDPTKVGRQR